MFEKVRLQLQSIRPLVSALLLLVMACFTYWLARVDRRENGFENFSVVSSALCIYYENHGRLPPLLFTHNSFPTVSWRALLNNHVDPPPFSSELGIQLNRTWSDRGNAEIGGSRYGVGLHRHGDGSACVYAIHGPGSPFSDPVEVDGSGRVVLPFSHEIKELPRDLVLIVSVRQNRIHWMEPGDLELSELTSMGAESTCESVPIFGDAVKLGFADGAVWEISGKTPLRVLIPFLTMTATTPPEGGRDRLLSPYLLREYGTTANKKGSKSQ